MKNRAHEMGATQVTNFHAEPFTYGKGTMIAIVGYGVARKGAKPSKSNPTNKDGPKRNPSGGGVAFPGMYESRDAEKAWQQKFDRTGRYHPQIDNDDFLEAADLVINHTSYGRNYQWFRTPHDAAREMSMNLEDGKAYGHDYVMFGSNGFWSAKDDDFRGEGMAADIEKGINDVESYARVNEKEWAVISPRGFWPYGKPAKSNTIPRKYISREKMQGNERRYKGHIIRHQGKGRWEVAAYGREFETLQKARDYITKHVKQTAKPNGRCCRTVKAKRCAGSVRLSKKKYRCDKCGAEYREE
jgi:hypothetical protein